MPALHAMKHTFKCNVCHKASAACLTLQLCILDGNKYNSRCREMGEQRMEILDECEVLKNQKGEPLMVAGGVANSIESPQVVLKFRANETFVSLK